MHWRKKLMELNCKDIQRSRVCLTSKGTESRDVRPFFFIWSKIPTWVPVWTGKNSFRKLFVQFLDTVSIWLFIHKLTDFANFHKFVIFTFLVLYYLNASLISSRESNAIETSRCPVHRSGLKLYVKILWLNLKQTLRCSSLFKARKELKIL